MPNLRKGSKRDSNPGSLDSESGILPLSYRAPHIGHLSVFVSKFSNVNNRNELLMSVNGTSCHQ